MPFIRITVFGTELTASQIEQLQIGTTDLMTSIMRKPLVGTAVLVEHVSSGGWSIAGATAELAAHVEATIGQGTNTPEEKGKYIAETMNLLRRVLGDRLKDETYVSLLEFDHHSYGRGGLTRAERLRLKAA